MLIIEKISALQSKYFGCTNKKIQHYFKLILKLINNQKLNF